MVMAPKEGASSAGGAQALPIRLHAPEIMQAIKEHPTVVVIGETGSGKTTQISQVGKLPSTVVSVLDPLPLTAQSAFPCIWPAHPCCCTSWRPAAVYWFSYAALLPIIGHAHCFCLQMLLKAGYAESGMIAVTQPRRVVRRHTIVSRLWRAVGMQT